MNAAFATGTGPLRPRRRLPRPAAGRRRGLLPPARPRRHYENFTVASLLLPRRLRAALPRRLRLLPLGRRPRRRGRRRRARPRPAALVARANCCACYDGTPRHPVLRRPARRPSAASPSRREPFLDLLVAFEQDQRVKRYATFDATARLLPPLGQPRRPARAVPVRVRSTRSGPRCPTTSARRCNWPTSGRTWPATSTSAASTCPSEDRRRFGYGDDDLAARRFTPAFAELMRFEVDRTRDLFYRGLPLVELLPRGLPAGHRAVHRAAAWRSCGKIERAGYDVWARRPALAKWEKATLLLGCCGDGSPE